MAICQAERPQIADVDAGVLRGGYREDGSITPTSIRLERLLATLTLLLADDSQCELMQESIAASLSCCACN